MKVGILQCGRAPEPLVAEHGDYDDMCAALLGSEFETPVYRVLDDEFPDSVNEAAGWLITGSRHGVYEEHSWIPPLEEFLRDAFSKSIPIVGICFGHQILAQALGGKVEKFNGGWSVGLVTYEMKNREMKSGELHTEEVHGGHETLNVNAFHQDQIVTPPAGASVTGSTEFCRYAFLAYGDKAMSMQPHPEFSNRFTRELLETRGREVLPEPALQQGLASFQDEAEQDKIAQQIREFFLIRQS